MSKVSFDLAGKVAIVTGAASGIGQAISAGLAEHGALIGLLDLANADLRQTISMVEAAGSEALALGADVTDGDSLSAAVVDVENQFGPLSLAVNSAGIANAGRAEDMPLLQWQKVYDIDVTGVFLSCQAEGRALIRNGGGSIVNIASMSGTIVNRGLNQAHYNSAKAAVTHFSRSLAMEWVGHNIRVNSISPGYTATAMNLRPEVADQAKQFTLDTPMGRMADPSEIAGPAVFLLSDAASFVTGIDLLVDGGFCAW